MEMHDEIITEISTQLCVCKNWMVPLLREVSKSGDFPQYVVSWVCPSEAMMFVRKANGHVAQ